jgi:hypothetical protein
MTITTKLITVTPAMARSWLQHNVMNRNIRPAKVARLAEHIATGTFRTTHQGIAFFNDSTLADGQHRLSAIVLADKPVEIYVTQGLSREAAEAVDFDIAPRKMSDVFKMAGTDTLLASNRGVAIIRALLSQFNGCGPRSKQLTLRDIEAYYSRHQQAFDAVYHNLPQRHDRWSQANVMAVYVTATAAQALTVHDMQRFHSIFATGTYDNQVPGEEMAVVLRNQYIDLGQNAWRNHKGASTARKMQRAIDYFVTGHTVKPLREPKEFVWPIPAFR